MSKAKLNKKAFGEKDSFAKTRSKEDNHPLKLVDNQKDKELIALYQKKLSDMLQQEEKAKNMASLLTELLKNSK